MLPDEELQIREELERLADDDGTPPSSMSSRHSHEDDEDKMPEEAFMKYTKDSRTVTPIPSKDDSTDQTVQDKKPIKVDMRDSVDEGAKEEGAKQGAPTSASTPRRPAPRGPAIQKQRVGTTKYQKLSFLLSIRTLCFREETQPKEASETKTKEPRVKSAKKQLSKASTTIF